MHVLVSLLCKGGEFGVRMHVLRGFMCLLVCYAKEASSCAIILSISCIMCGLVGGELVGKWVGGFG